jgi:hypothetical protein
MGFMSEPRILLWDVETTPSLVYTWGQWQTNVIATKQDWYLLSFAYKWYGEKAVHFVHNQGKKNDKPVVKALHALLDEADIVVAHNGDKFDQSKANTRFMRWRLGPPSPYQSIDTLKEVRRQFNHYSNALNELGRYHQLGVKEKHTGIQLWLDCMGGDEKAMADMERYNKRDVLLLEDVYKILLPWIGTPGKRGHPNMNHWSDGTLVCSRCGSERVIKRGFHRTALSVFQTVECKECKGYSKLRQRDLPAPGKGVKAS